MCVGCSNCGLHNATTLHAPPARDSKGAPIREALDIRECRFGCRLYRAGDVIPKSAMWT